MPSLQASAGDEVGRTGILGHVERVFITHVDDAGADFDLFRAGADGGQKREGRGKLAGEMMHAEIGAVGSQFFRRDGEVDRLQQRVRSRAGLRLGRGRPVAEGEESDLFHDDLPDVGGCRSSQTGFVVVSHIGNRAHPQSATRKHGVAEM